MGYSDIQRSEQNVPVVDVLESTGDKFKVGFKRPATVLGWGIVVTVLRGSPAVNPVIELDHDLAGAGARSNKDSVTLTDASPQGVIERSELMRGQTLGTDEAVLAPFDVAAGDHVIIEVATAETAATAGEVMFYVLWAPKGSP